jgi:hypothetical protein
MNPIKIALNNITYAIPNLILEEAFKDTISNHRPAPISLEARITNKVIKPRVLIDTNLVGGRMAIIPLVGLRPEYVSNGLIFTIPPERTQFLSIMSVLSVNYLPNQHLFYNAYNAMNTCDANNPLLQVANRVGMSMDNIPIVSTATADIIGENVILIQNVNPTLANYAVRCILANDPNFNNLNPRSIPAFSKLCTLAVKSYIYNILIVKIDVAYLQGGMELGAFKNIVETYSDAEEQYQTHLNEIWGAVAFMNDSARYERFIRLQISPGL